MVKTVDLSEPGASLTELVALVNSGTQVIVTRAGNPVARLVPVDATVEPRKPDLHPGAFVPSEDFDAAFRRILGRRSMKLLLDTHAFMWWDSQSSRLSPRALAACSDPANELLLSTASVWEMQIKVQLGKLQLRAPLASLIAHQRANGITILQVSIEHVLGVGTLPPIHRDPFDRILVAQANEEGAWLVSNDPVMPQYPVKLLW